MKKRGLLLLISLLWPVCAPAAEVSSGTEECLDCHRSATPGIVADWERSRHARITLEEAMKQSDLKRRVSVSKVPKSSARVVVGCAECHVLNSKQHKDTFEHNGSEVHTVVTPKDCATCHPTEAKQYSQNIMSRAYGNLNDNPVYRDLVDSVNGIQSFKNMRTTLAPRIRRPTLIPAFTATAPKSRLKVKRPGRQIWARWSFLSSPAGPIRVWVA